MVVYIGDRCRREVNEFTRECLAIDPRRAGRGRFHRRVVRSSAQRSILVRFDDGPQPSEHEAAVVADRDENGMTLTGVGAAAP